jgi:phenylalanyl-tRNA synthetase beta chain
MGSASAEVSQATTDVLLESAMFQPTGITRTARRLGLRTEASIRFERGADPEAVAGAASRAAALISAWSGGVVARGAVDVGQPPSRRSVSVSAARASNLLGVALTADDVGAALSRLRLPATIEGDDVTVEVPGYRVDLERPADLVEEVGRVRGYGELPSTLPGVRQAGGLSREQRLRGRVKDVLAGAGVWEAVSSSFVPASDLELFDDDRRHGVRMANPIAAGEAFLRSSLLPGLLRAARGNVARGRTSIRVFEVGTVFRTGAEAPIEEERVTALFAGPATEGWPGEPREQDLLDAKGTLEHLMASVGVVGWQVGPPAGRPFHPARSSTVTLGGSDVGEVGELHPRVAEAFDVPMRVAALDVGLASVLGDVPGRVEYAEVSRFPPVHRDLAFTVDRGVAVGALREALVDAAGPLLDRVLVLDVYEGEPLPEGKKGVAFAVDFRAPDRTLTAEEAEEHAHAVTDRLARDFGAELRGG